MALTSRVLGYRFSHIGAPCTLLALFFALGSIVLGSTACGGKDIAPTDGTDAATELDAEASDGGAVDSAVPQGGKTVRIGTYNVKQFFDTVCDTGACAPNDFEEKPTEPQFRAKAAALGAGIRKTQADVMLLEEVENQASVDALKAVVPEFAYAQIGETGFNASMDVVVLSKDPIKAVRTHRDQRIPLPTTGTTKFIRELLEVDLERNGVLYTVFVGHFKSKAQDDPAQRLAEANATRGIVTLLAKNNPTRLIVFGGDLNDSPGSPPINALEQAENGVQLVRTESIDLPIAGQNTYFGTSLRSPIDHLFIPKPVVGYYVSGTAAVVQDAPLKGLGGSDHAALVATYRLAAP
jgi:uncharacterized protein